MDNSLPLPPPIYSPLPGTPCVQPPCSPHVHVDSESKGLWPRPLRISLFASVPTYREPIRTLGHPWSHLGMSLRSQSQTRIKTKYPQGSEILNGQRQRPFSSLQVFPLSLSLSLSLSPSLPPH